MVTVEQLYKKFGVLADAKDKAGEVKRHIIPCNFKWVGKKPAKLAPSTRHDRD